MSFAVPEASRMTSGPLGSDASIGANGAFRLPSPEPGWELWIIASDGTDPDVPQADGWEHVSVHAFKEPKVIRTPTWKEMAFVKDQFWGPEDVVVQYHPAKSTYINNHPHVLHLWRLRGVAFPVPPPELVGVR